MNTLKYLLPALLAPMLCAAVPSASNPLAPQAAFAQLKSSHLGIAVPKGGASYSEADAHFSTLLRDLAEQKIVSKAPQGEVEVFIWKGAAYREDRAAFTRSALKRALVAAGWQAKEIDSNELGGLSLSKAFDANEGPLPFAPALTKKEIYFQTSNAKSGQAVVGAWLESDNAQALALLPIEFVAPKKTIIPAAPIGTWLVRDNSDTTKGMPAPKMPAFPKMSPRPRTVRGMALNAVGKPLANVEVSVYSSIGGGVRTTHKGRTNAQGIYQVLVPAGVCEVAQADAKVSYNGTDYSLKLAPVRGEFAQFNSATGHVEHLILRTSGSAGGTIYIREDVDGPVEVTVTPVGKLMDGSAGRAFVYRFDASERHEMYLHGLPLGRYTLTARLFDGDEALPLRVGYSPGYSKDTTMGASMTFSFEPGYAYLREESGKSSSDVTYIPVTLKP